MSMDLDEAQRIISTLNGLKVLFLGSDDHVGLVVKIESLINSIENASKRALTTAEELDNRLERESRNLVDLLVEKTHDALLEREYQKIENISISMVESVAQNAASIAVSDLFDVLKRRSVANNREKAESDKSKKTLEKHARVYRFLFLLTAFSFTAFELIRFNQSALTIFLIEFLSS